MYHKVDAIVCGLLISRRDVDVLSISVHVLLVVCRWSQSASVSSYLYAGGRLRAGAWPEHRGGEDMCVSGT